MTHAGGDDSRQLTRRPVLMGIGTLGFAGLAGCISADDVNVDGDAEGLIYDGLQEVGVEPPVETTLYTQSESEARVRAGELLQNELNSTDLFDISFEALNWGSFLDLLNNMATEEENALVYIGLTGGWDPHTYVYPSFHSDSATPNGQNINHFQHGTVDRLIDEGVAEPDHDERIEIYQELQELLVEESPVSFVRFTEEVITYRDDVVDGFRTFPMAGSEYKSIYAPTLGVYTKLADGEDELIGDIGTSIPSYDPTVMTDTVSMLATGLIYEQLLEIDFDGRIRPLLATDWAERDDQTWWFELREGVEFHEGGELTAADVKASLERYAGTPRESDVYDWYEGMEILGDYEFEISLSRPYGPLETMIAGVPIVPEGVAGGDIDLTAQPVGTGPYEFGEHDPDSLWRMQANDDHWHDGSNDVPETPPIETITLRVIPEPSSRRSSLETGDTHLSTNVPLPSIESFEDDEAFVVDRAVSGGFDYLGYPSYLEPFTNAKVRRGIGQLIPRERIIEDVYHGSGTVAYTPVSPLLESFVDSEFEAYIADEYVN